jgi:hypothetical protein
MKSITKYCKPEHRFNRTDKLQIGTLEYYRDHENIKISDPQEGLTKEYIIKGGTKGITIGKDRMKYLTGGLLTDVDVVLKEEGKLHLKVNRFVPNQYIFCATDEHIGNRETAYLLGYTDWYTIFNVREFIDRAALSLIKKMRFTNPLIYNCLITGVHAKVEYGDGPIHLEHSNFSVFLDGVFRKPKNSDLDRSVDFQKNNEYRLLWTAYDEVLKTVHSVHKEPVLVDFTPEMKALCR